MGKRVQKADIKEKKQDSNILRNEGGLVESERLQKRFPSQRSRVGDGEPICRNGTRLGDELSQLTLPQVSEPSLRELKVSGVSLSFIKG